MYDKRKKKQIGGEGWVGVEIEGGKELGQAGISFTLRSQTWSAVSLSLISAVCLFTSLAPSLPPSLSFFSLSVSLRLSLSPTETKSQIKR